MSLLRRLTPPVADSVRIFLCMGAGDILAQTYLEEKDLEDINYVRTVKYATIGLIFVSPLMNFWRTMDFNKNSSPLNFACHAQQGGSAVTKQILRILQKIVLHQLVFAPVLNMGVIAAVGIMNGDKSEKVRAKIDKDFVSVMKQNYMIWPPAQLLNNLIMPPPFRLPFYQAVAVYWHMYLSNKLQGTPISEHDRKKKDEAKKRELEKKEKEKKEKERAKQRTSK